MTSDEFIIIARFKLKPDARERFLEAVGADAEASVRDEPGCQRFDILLPADEADVVVLHEVYDDEGAFKRHLEAPHYYAFRNASAELIEDQTVYRCGRIAHTRA